MITFANSMDPDQVGQFLGPNLNPNWKRLKFKMQVLTFQTEKNKRAV